MMNKEKNVCNNNGKSNLSKVFWGRKIWLKQTRKIILILLIVVKIMALSTKVVIVYLNVHWEDIFLTILFSLFT